MSSNPTFKEHLDVRVVPGTGAFVLSERGHHLLGGDLHEHLAPLLDGARSMDEIASALEARFPPHEVMFAILELERRGFLVGDAPWEDPGAGAFWRALDAEPAEASRRIAGAALRVVALGDVPAEACMERLRRHGLSVREDGDHTVVLTDHYLHDALPALNRRMMEEGRPWTLARPVGLEPWVGPVFVPGRTACWECLAVRLRGNFPVEELVRRRGASGRPLGVHRSALPATLDLALGLLSTGLQSWIGADSRAPFAGAVVTYDVWSGTGARHPVTRRPQCPVCGDPGLYGRRLERGVRLERTPVASRHDGGYRAVPPERTVERFGDLVSPVTGVVHGVRRATPGESPVSVYVASHAAPALAHPHARLRRLPGLSSAGGKGRGDVQARASVLGEAVERASGLFQGDEPTVRASLRELGEEAIHPNACMLFSERQYEERDPDPDPTSGHHAVPPAFDEGATLEWSPVWSLTGEHPRYLPTMYLYFAHPTPPDSMYCPPDSNGNACGNTLEEAVLQGSLELVERDAVGIWWYNRIPRPAVDLSGAGDPWVERLLAHYEDVGRELWAVDLTTDLGIPVRAAVSRRREGPEEILLGFGAHLDARLALSRALTEVNQMYALVEAARAADDLGPGMATWLAGVTVEGHPHLRPAAGGSVPTAPRGPEPPSDLADAVLHCRARFEAGGLEMLVLDQTRPDLHAPVVKVIVPGLRHFWARFAPGRLYDVPVERRWLDRPRREEDMNPVRLFV